MYWLKAPKEYHGKDRPNKGVVVKQDWQFHFFWITRNIHTMVREHCKIKKGKIMNK